MINQLNIKQIPLLAVKEETLTSTMKRVPWSLKGWHGAF